MADKRISQLVERINIANNDVLPIVASGAITTNKVTISTIQDWMQDNLDVGVTSVGITLGTTGTNINVTGSPVTSSGNITINIPTASATNRGALSSADWSTFNSKVSSVGLSMPSAFTVSNSPITSSGTIAVTGAGTVSQYIRGDGSLADFPQGGGGGGASVNYYLNGSVSQGTIGGIAYYEMNKTPILGTGTDFVAIADGYLASFITDAGDPSLLQIPGGNWNFETYFSASSGGGTPTFYVELYKVDSGGTATLIASNSGTPELIAFGTTITPYFSTLAVPTTTLALTDRLALRYYVARSGRTITMHTENSHLCQIITTFTTGLTALNGLTAQVQNFDTGTSGSDFNISSSSSTHTFNLPNASDTARGVVTTGTQTFAGYKIFNGTIGVNNDLQLATVGTALNTFIKNINSTGLTSIGSNGFGFNNANNIYFSGSSKGGGVFAFSNTGTQTYTLQDASGTLAFTSQIPTNPVGGTGAQGRVAYWNGSGTITSDSLFQWNDTFKRLGIGRTPTVSLDVEGAGFFSSSVTANGVMSLGNDGTFGSNYKTLGLTGNTTGSHRIFAGTSDDFFFAAATGRGFEFRANGGGVANLYIASTGNVGIGTASPTSYNADFSNLVIANTSSFAGMTIATASNSYGTIAFADGTTGNEKFRGYIQYSHTDDAMTFASSATERMRITSGGFLKAKGTESTYQGISTGYHELRTGTGDEWITFFSNTAGSPYGIRVHYPVSAPNNTSNLFLLCSDVNASRFIVLSNGNVQNQNNSYGAISDIKLKENITDASPKLDDLLKVKVRNYNFRGEDKKQIGVIAQELEEIFPAMIEESEDFEEVEVPQLNEEGNEILNEEGEVVTTKERVSKGTTTKSVKYSVFVPMLIKAIQELKTEIDSLKNQIK